MFAKLKKAWRRWRLDRDFRKKGIVGKNRKVEDSAIAVAADKSRALEFFLLFLLWAVGALFLTFPCRSAVSHNLIVGEPAPKSVFSEMPFSYVSELKTSIARENAGKNSPDYYIIDSQKTDAVLKRFHNFFQEITKRYAVEKQKIENTGADRNLKYTASPLNPFSAEVAALSGEDFVIFSNLFADESTWRDFYQERDRLIYSGIFSSAVKNQKPAGKKIIVIDLAGRQHNSRLVDDIPSVEKAAKILGDKISGRLSTQRIFMHLLGSDGNLVLDRKTSEEAAKNAASSVQDVIVDVKQYTPIVTQKSVVDEETLEKGSIICDNCGETLEFSFEDDEDEE